MTANRSLGPRFAKREDDTAVPSLVATCRGTILEIGPGCGTQIPRFDRNKVTKIYGAEPTLALHPALRAKAVQARLEDRYEVIPCAADDLEDLERFGIVENSMDTVLSAQVLCSVTDARQTAKGLYKLLKPGGELIVFEHMKSSDGVSRVMQSKCTLEDYKADLTVFLDFWSWPWSVALGGCKLTQPTMDAIVNAGSWERIELDGDYKDTVSMFPRIWGRLVKAKE